MTRPSVQSRIESLLDYPGFPIGFGERRRIFHEYAVETATVRLIDGRLASLEVGRPLVIHGPAWSGKTHLLKRHLRPAKQFGREVTSSQTGGVLFSVDNCQTPKALALAVCQALSPETVDGARATTESAVRNALDISSQFQGIVAIDDFNELLLPCGTLAPEMEGFLNSLSSCCRLVFSGREDGIPQVMRLLPGLSAQVSDIMHVGGYKPGDPALAKILVELEEAMGFGPATYFTSTGRIRSFAEVVPSGVIGAYKSILWDAFVDVIDRYGAGLDENAIAHGIAVGSGCNGILSSLIRREPRKTSSLKCGEAVIRLKDTLVSQDEERWHRGRDQRDKVRPRDGIWRIPVSTEVRIPVLPEERLELAATVIHRGGDHRREDRICLDALSGCFYHLDESDDVIDEIRDAILDEAELLIGADDNPQAFSGFPWFEGTFAGVTKRIARNVEALLPRIVSRYAATDCGRLLLRTNVPQLFVREWKEGVTANVEPNINSAADLVRSFDFDDLEGVRKFARVLDRVANRETRDPFRLSGALIEHRQGIIPRDSFRRMMVAIGAKTLASMDGMSIPAQVDRSFGVLFASPGRPNRAEAQVILDALKVINDFRSLMGIDAGRDFYSSNMTTLDLAIVRAKLIAEDTDQP